MHVWGQPASANPLMYLKRVDASGWFETYARTFDAIWDIARPWTSGLERTTTHGQD